MRRSTAAVRRTDAIFDIERRINGLPPSQRLGIRQERAAPLVASLESWMRTACGKMSSHADAAKAMDYMLMRWEAFSRFLGDGRICLINNTAERALRGIVLGKAWLSRAPIAEASALLQCIHSLPPG